MGVKVATTCLHWSQPIVPQSPSSSQTLASAISSPSSNRRSRGDSGPLVFRHVQKLDRSALFGNSAKRLHRSRSSEYSNTRPGDAIRRACSANFAAFSDEEFSRKIQELALRFQLSNDEEDSNSEVKGDAELESVSESRDTNHNVNVTDSYNSLSEEKVEHPWPENRCDPPEWQDETIPATIERKANSVDLPLSLRIIQRKMQWQEGFREAGELAYCSMKRAFSSMVFIIQELQSFTLQMREVLFYEDLQGILVRVQKEMHASFVWLFQQIFSHTPTLMVYVMILLANFTVYSMSSNAAIAVAPPVGSHMVAAETASMVQILDGKEQKFDSSSIKTYRVSSSSGKTTSIGGNNGGGKVRPLASGTDGDGHFSQPDYYRTILPDGASQLSSFGTTPREAESVTGRVGRDQEELSLWNSMVDEVGRMQAESRDEALDHEAMQRFVSPVTAKIEADDYAEYFRTELLYQTSLAQDSNNSLLLANYAQFLYLVAHDYDRAEEYFKKAVAVEPRDGEAYSKYASFLWRVRNDLWAAEETYLEAISADPTNSFYAANYANFLWNTGGEDTCFPATSLDQSRDDAQQV